MIFIAYNRPLHYIVGGRCKRDWTIRFVKCMVTVMFCSTVINNGVA